MKLVYGSLLLWLCTTYSIMMFYRHGYHCSSFYNDDVSYDTLHTLISHQCPYTIQTLPYQQTITCIEGAHLLSTTCYNSSMITFKALLAILPFCSLTTGDYGETPLFDCVRHDCSIGCTLLLDRGAQYDHSADNTMKPIDYAFTPHTMSIFLKKKHHII